MELTPNQRDALTELVNIGYGRAASALSELSGYRVTLDVPRVGIHKIDSIVPVLESVVSGEVASVNQVFSGPISGNALLLLDQDSARVLSRLLRDEESLLGTFDTDDREIVAEVGNILLNACLGVFGNELRVRFSFAMPRLHVTDVSKVLQSVVIDSECLRYGLMIHTRFHLRANNVTGYLVVVLGITSLDCMLHAIDQWETRQTAR